MKSVKWGEVNCNPLVPAKHTYTHTLSCDINLPEVSQGYTASEDKMMLVKWKLLIPPHSPTAQTTYLRTYLPWAEVQVVCVLTRGFGGGIGWPECHSIILSLESTHTEDVLYGINMKRCGSFFPLAFSFLLIFASFPHSCNFWLTVPLAWKKFYTCSSLLGGHSGKAYISLFLCVYAWVSVLWI